MSGVDDDVFDLPGGEAGGGDPDEVFSGRDGEEGECTGGVGLRGAGGFGFVVLEVMCALEMVAWSVSVTVPERTEALGASGNWVVGICWARRPTAQEPRKRRRAQRLLALGAGLCFDLVHPMAAAACPATPIARMVAGECRLSKENVCVLRLHAGAAESAPDVMGATRADRATTRAR